jgi:MFS family permease
MRPISTTTRIAAIALIGGIGGGLVFPILPALGLQLGIPGFMIGLILSANRISRLFFNIPAGFLIGRLGPRLVLFGALMVETLGVLGFSAALYSAHPALWLLGGRIIFGIGTAFLFVGAQAAVISLSSRTDRGSKTAVVRVAVSIAVPVGLILGGVLADRFSDNAAFLTGAAVTFLGALFSLAALPKLEAKPITKAETQDKPSAYSAILKSPNLPIIAAACSFNMMIFMTVQGALLATMVVLVSNRGITVFSLQAAGTSGMIMAVMVACSALVSIAIGRAIDKVALRSLLIVPALLVLAGGFLTLAFAQSLWVVLAGTILVGLSYNGVTLPALALLADAVDDRQHGPAVGAYQFFGDIGGTIGPMLGIELGTRLGLLPLYVILAALPVIAVLGAIRMQAHERNMIPAGSK